MRKPFREIYELLIARFNIIPEKAIYIDDNLRNLVPVPELGFHTIHIQTAGQFKKELAGLLAVDLPA
jgi:2-haloacid dehalogenase